MRLLKAIVVPVLGLVFGLGMGLGILFAGRAARAQSSAMVWRRDSASRRTRPSRARGGTGRTATSLKTGITKDLEWMKRVGHRRLSAGGCGVGQRAGGGERRSTSGRRSGITRCVIRRKRRSGLIWRCRSSVRRAGARQAGPWVKPQMAMKKLVWSETDSARAGRRLRGSCRSRLRMKGRCAIRLRADAAVIAEFYADSAVIAYRTPADEVPMASLHPKVTTNGGADRCGGAAGRQPEHVGERLLRRRTAGRRGCSMSLRSRLRRGRCRLGARSRIPVGQDSGER